MVAAPFETRIASATLAEMTLPLPGAVPPISADAETPSTAVRPVRDGRIACDVRSDVVALNRGIPLVKDRDCPLATAGDDVARRRGRSADCHHGGSGSDAAPIADGKCGRATGIRADEVSLD